MSDVWNVEDGEITSGFAARPTHWAELWIIGETVPISRNWQFWEEAREGGVCFSDEAYNVTLTGLLNPA